MFSARSGYQTDVRSRRSRLYHYSSLGDQIQVTRSIRSRIIFSARFYISIAITSIVVLVQLLLFHHYIGFNTNRLTSSHSPIRAIHILEDWNCLYPGLLDIIHLSQNYGVDLVVIDPDLLKRLDRETNDSQDEVIESLVFSDSSKSSQESFHKSIIHLAAINETSGGQPNLKLFYNALISNGYRTLKYDDSSQILHPEVYRRAFHLFDDMPPDGEHRHAHDSNLNHDNKQTTGSLYDSHQNEVSKIYTEFITHIFVLNRTEPLEERYPCTKFRSKPARFIPVHVVVLYNYEYDPSRQWIQPILFMDELDKHKLLSANVHSFDFKIPLDAYYVHPKRDLASIVKPSDRELGRRTLSANQVKVFEPQGDRLLNFANNTYVHCHPSQFSIAKLIENPKKLSKYIITLDSARPVDDLDIRRDLHKQLVVGLKFIDTFAKTYGNLTYWLTGSSLLAYYKYCDLAVPNEVVADPSEVVVNLELGFFASEVNDTILDDLANARTIGVVMLSNWRGSNLVMFQFRDCPNLIFYLYLYELRRDFYQYYFLTRTTMTMNHKFNKRPELRSALSSVGHHVFNTNNLDLCWTRADNLHPSRVPCNTYDHLRRIYVI